MSYLDDPRVYLAAERTVLAWVRTGLALMGFGTVLGKQLLDTSNTHPTFAIILGIVLCGLGTAGNLLAVVQFIHLLKTLSSPERPPRDSSVISILTALISGLVGVALMAYIVLI